MAYKLVFTDTFEKDLDSILDHIANKLFNSAAAAALYKNVKSTFASVAEFPEMFPFHPLDQIGDKGYRYCQIGNYLAFYTVDDKQQTVYAAAMIYGASDLTKSF